MKYFLAVGLPFAVLMLFGNTLIRILERLSFGQQVRGEGPKSHLKKEGIPTMGGILIIIGILISAFLLFDLNSYVMWALITTTGLGLVGFLDDIIKIKSQRSLGLKAREKLLGQILFGALLAIYVYYFSNLGTGLIVPFTGQIIELGFWIIPLIIFIVTGFSNAVNLTDGLDGLAAGVTAIVASAFAVIASALQYDQLALFGLAVTGASLGFIWYNSHPAQVFMGDVGSLALGGAVASLAVLSRTEIFLLFIGGVYVLETASVMIQVSYFKFTGGKRVFRMTPIHHHFELAGLSETKVVSRFLILAIIFASLGIISFYAIF